MSTVRNLPDDTFKIRSRDTSLGGDNPLLWQDHSTYGLFGDRKVVVSQLPGASIPTCFASHLPGFEEFHDDFQEDNSNLGYGVRSWRYALLAINGVIGKMIVEAAYSDNCSTDPLELCDTDTAFIHLTGWQS